MLVDGTGQLVSRTTCLPPAKPQPRRSVLPAQPRRSARIRKVCTSLPCCFFLRVVGFGFGFALPLSFFFCDLLAWFVEFFFHPSIERKEERMKERVLIARLCLLPSSSLSSSTAEQVCRLTRNRKRRRFRKHFLLSSFFYFFFSQNRSID
jgi:hypothetical protein